LFLPADGFYSLNALFFGKKNLALTAKNSFQLEASCFGKFLLLLETGLDIDFSRFWLCGGGQAMRFSIYRPAVLGVAG